ncbi:putative conjugal transfer protein TraU [Orientia chuto str. Dubai]|uniref:Putative conjugal transfer protein TraU n=1 Tax=Orientia chuto str. Dubai TaxID=1359168 RepID=A0A0F3MNE7_9RICK|nr:putative conjugal transfer protein TraU [Orientia chuto str. Dubai]
MIVWQVSNVHYEEYRLQMIYPIPEVTSCKRIGETEATWQAGREFPVNG